MLELKSARGMNKLHQALPAQGKDAYLTKAWTPAVATCIQSRQGIDQPYMVRLAELQDSQHV